jgi:hypothetical protein
MGVGYVVQVYAFRKHPSRMHGIKKSRVKEFPHKNSTCGAGVKCEDSMK